MALPDSPKPLAGDLKQQKARGPFIFGVIGAVVGIPSLPLLISQVRDGSPGSLTMLLTLTAIPAAVLGLLSAAMLWTESMNLPRSRSTPGWDTSATIAVAVACLAIAVLGLWWADRALTIGEINLRGSGVISRQSSPIMFYTHVMLSVAFSSGMVWLATRTVRRLLRSSHE